MFKKVVSLVLVFVLCLSVAACGGNKADAPVADAPAENAPAANNPAENAPAAEGAEKEPVTLYVLVSQTAKQKDLEALVTGFEAAFPHVTIDLETTDTANSVLGARIAGGKIPNILATGDYPDEMYEAGMVLDMSEVFSLPAFDSEGTVLESMSSGSDKARVKNGVSYYMPTQPAACAWVVNKTMFEDNNWDIPTNWEELVAVSKKINDAGITPLAWGGLGGENRHEMSTWICGVMNAGGDDYMKAIDNLEKGAWADKAYYGYEQIKELLDVGVIDESGLGMDCPQSQVAFVQRQYAMVISGHWFTAEMADQMGDDEYIIIAPPLNKNGSETKYYNTWYNGYLAHKSSDPAVDAATKDFLRYVVSYEYQKKMIENGTTMVVNRKVMAEVAADPNLDSFAKSLGALLADSNNVGVYPGYTQWYIYSMQVPYHIDVINDVLAGRKTPKEAGEAMEAQAEIVRNDDSVLKFKR